MNDGFWLLLLFACSDYCSGRASEGILAAAKPCRDFHCEWSHKAQLEMRLMCWHSVCAAARVRINPSLSSSCVVTPRSRRNRRRQTSTFNPPPASRPWPDHTTARHRASSAASFRLSRLQITAGRTSHTVSRAHRVSIHCCVCRFCRDSDRHCKLIFYVTENSTVFLREIFIISVLHVTRQMWHSRL